MNEYIEINGQRVYEGAIVTLSGYPDTRWLLCNGWFAYQGNYYMGWYFKSIPQGTVIAASAPTFSSTTSDTPTVTVKTPTINTRCNSSYFATDRKTYIDTTTPIKFICEQYELPTIKCIETQLHEGVIDLYNHPLT